MGWRCYPPTLISGSVHRKGERKKSEQWVERASKTISAGMGSIRTSKCHKGRRQTNTAASGGHSVGLWPYTSALVHKSVAYPTPTTSPLLFPHCHGLLKTGEELSVQTLAPPCPITHWTLKPNIREEKNECLNWAQNRQVHSERQVWGPDGLWSRDGSSSF